MADSGVNIRISATDKASAQINAVGKSLAGLSNQVGSVQNAVNSLATGGIPGLTRSMSTLSGVVSGSVPVWAGLLGIVGAAGGALIGFMTSSANAAEELQNMSAITGLATDKLEGLQRIAEDAGLGTDTLASGIGKLNRQLASGEGGDFTKVMAAMGGSIKDSSGEVKDAITLLDEMGEMLRGVESDTLRSQLANAAFGKSLQFLIPLITGSTEKLSDQIQKMKENGRIMDEITTQRMLKWDKALDEFKADWDRLTTAIKSNTGALLDWINTSALAEELRSQLRREGGAEGGWGAGEGTGASGAWGPAGKSPLEIQAEQEARARAIASGKRGEELAITLKIEDAERRMKEVHGDAQIAIANQIAGYKQQLEVIQKQNQALEKQKQLLEGLDISRRPEIPGPPGEERAPKFEIIDKEQAKEQQKGFIRESEDARWEAFARGTVKQERLLDKAADYGKDRIDDQARHMAQAHEKAIAQNQRQWERMYDSIRDGAGEVFDAMLTKGESVFTSLAKFAQGILQTMLRNIFQNAVTGLLTAGSRPGTGGGGGGFLGSLMGLGGIAMSSRGAASGMAQSGGITYATGAASGGAKGGIGGFFGKLFGGGGGAAGAAGLGSSLAMGAATAGISMALGLGLSFVGGLFNRGAKKRAEEEARRKALIESQQFTAPEAITRYGIAGGAGYTVEAGLTGEIRGIGKTPTVITNVNVQMIDAKSADAAGNIIADTVSKRIMMGGTYLADNIAWSAS